MMDRIKLDMDAIAEASRQAYADGARVAIRDQFAMAALTGLCADPGTGGHTTDKMARTCYALADAMLAAREAK